MMLARFLGMGLICISINALADSLSWKIIPNESVISFTATQNGAPVTGKFNNFSGDIQFDPADLKKSKVSIDVDTASVSTSYGEVAHTLKTPDWFNSAVFPIAEFKADQFHKVDDKHYEAIGNLKIRDKSMPIVLRFELVNYSKEKALANGYAKLKRTDFGVGQGDWAKTDTIKDEVKIDFSISAKK